MSAYYAAGSHVYLVREEAIEATLTALEKAVTIREAFGHFCPMPGTESCARIRALRERLIDRDMYEHIYGPFVPEESP